MKLMIVVGASAIVGAVAIGLYVVTRTGAVCPVQNEAFYDHFYAKALEVNSDTQKAAAIATYGAAVAARVVKEINERDGEVRQAYRDCVAGSTFGTLPGRAPLSTEEACVAIITTAASLPSKLPSVPLDGGPGSARNNAGQNINHRGGRSSPKNFHRGDIDI